MPGEDVTTLKISTKTAAAIASAAVVTALIGAAVPATAAPAPYPPVWTAANDPADRAAQHVDDLEGPLSEQQRAERQVALQQLVNGKAKVETHGKSQSVRIGKDKYVELA